MNERWLEVLKLIEGKLSKPSFETWLKATDAKIEGNNWTIIAQNEFSRDWLESRYMGLIEETIQELTSEIPFVKVITDRQVGLDKLQDNRINHIITQINALHPSERKKLISILGEQGYAIEKNSTINASSTDHSERESTKEETEGRIEYLEREWKGMNERLHKLESKIIELIEKL